MENIPQPGIFGAIRDGPNIIMKPAVWDNWAPKKMLIPCLVDPTK
jgi:hypothetical protein